MENMDDVKESYKSTYRLIKTDRLKSMASTNRMMADWMDEVIAERRG